MALVRLFLRIYQWILSPALTVGFGIRCRYEISCSRYMESAIEEYGFIRGVAIGLRRLLSCNGWGAFKQSSFAQGNDRSSHG